MCVYCYVEQGIKDRYKDESFFITPNLLFDMKNNQYDS